MTPEYTVPAAELSGQAVLFGLVSVVASGVQRVPPESAIALLERADEVTAHDVKPSKKEMPDASENMKHCIVWNFGLLEYGLPTGANHKLATISHIRP